MARAVGARREEGDALNTMGATLGRLGQPEQAVALLEMALAIADALGGIDDLGRAYKNLAATLHDGLGEPGRGAAVALEGADRLDALSYEAGASNLRAAAALSFLVAGAWAQAESLATTVLAGTPDVVTAWQARLATGTVALRRGDLASAQVHLEHGRRLCAERTDTDFRAMLGAALVELALAEGRHDEARRLVEETLDALQDTDACDYVLQLVGLGLRTEADAGARPARGTRPKQPRERADALIERARSATVLLAGQPQPATPQGRALRAACDAEWARVVGEHDGTQWSEIAAAWLGVSRPYEAAYAAWRAAEAHLATGRKDEAVTALRQAHSQASWLGAASLVAETEALARRARVRLAGNEQVSPASGAATRLTPRETEVLALVAAGNTNHQIAESLYMSDKTASVHVSRILTKLGVANRGQAAAVAHRMQLLDEAAP